MHGFHKPCNYFLSLHQELNRTRTYKKTRYLSKNSEAQKENPHGWAEKFELLRASDGPLEADLNDLRDKAKRLASYVEVF